MQQSAFTVLVIASTACAQSDPPSRECAHAYYGEQPMCSRGTCGGPHQDLVRDAYMQLTHDAFEGSDYEAEDHVEVVAVEDQAVGLTKMHVAIRFGATGASRIVGLPLDFEQDYTLEEVIAVIPDEEVFTPPVDGSPRTIRELDAAKRRCEEQTGADFGRSAWCSGGLTADDRLQYYLYDLQPCASARLDLFDPARDTCQLGGCPAEDGVYVYTDE